ncbi:hypothetical protein BRADI_1g31196v3 [Brachypodium distachyon]|nr:hypothetical protein BRADI_1g31196v3 [Brachypodium distachyon]
MVTMVGLVVTMLVALVTSGTWLALPVAAVFAAIFYALLVLAGKVFKAEEEAQLIARRRRRRRCSAGSGEQIMRPGPAQHR